MDPEDRALTTNSLSYLHNPTGLRSKPPAKEFRDGEDSDSGIDTDSDVGAEDDFAIFTKPRKPSDCITHKVALPSVTHAFSNIRKANPRGGETSCERDAIESEECNMAMLHSTCIDQQLVTMPSPSQGASEVDETEVDEIMPESILSCSIPMPLDRMSRSHPTSHALPGASVYASDEHAIASGSGTLAIPGSRTGTRKPAAASGSLPTPGPCRTIFNSSGVSVGVTVGKSSPVHEASSAIKAARYVAVATNSSQGMSSHANVRSNAWTRSTRPRPTSEPLSKCKAAVVAHSSSGNSLPKQDVSPGGFTSKNSVKAVIRRFS